MADTLVVNEIYLSLQGESTFAGLPCVFVRLTACNLRCSYCDTAYAFSEGRKRSFEDILRRIGELAAPYAGTCPPPRMPPDESRFAIDEPLKVGRVAPRAPTSTVEREPSAMQGFNARGMGAGNSLPAPRLPLIEFTGGEPLLQPAAPALMRRLCDDGFTVLVETSGALDISGLDPRVRRIMDLKCPSSGEVQRNRGENLGHLRATDEVKFVIGTVEDYEWARAQVVTHGLHQICPILFSWVAPLSPEQQHPALLPVPAGQTALTRQQLVERIVADALPVRFQVQLHKIIWVPDQRGV